MHSSVISQTTSYDNHLSGNVFVRTLSKTWTMWEGFWGDYIGQNSLFSNVSESSSGDETMPDKQEA
jgi:hypothetical protein